jgi:hypothetical protein
MICAPRPSGSDAKSREGLISAAICGCRPGWESARPWRGRPNDNRFPSLPLKAGAQFIACLADRPFEDRCSYCYAAIHKNEASAEMRGIDAHKHFTIFLLG